MTLELVVLAAILSKHQKKYRLLFFQKPQMAPRDKLKRATFHDYMRGHCTKDQYFHKPIWKAHKENIDLRGDFMERALLANGRETERHV
jgi:hypothetical protein